MTEILSRLPVQALARSKCVCKLWLHLLRSNEFVKSHLAKPVPGLAVMYQTSCTIFELKEGEDLDLGLDLDSHNSRYKELTKFDLPSKAAVRGSANGLLFLFKGNEVHLVCNPITRDYMEVRFPEELIRPHSLQSEIIEKNVYYGFGVSKISGEYKVVRISHGSDCHVYTLGTGLWRRVEARYELDCQYLVDERIWSGEILDQGIWD